MFTAFGMLGSLGAGFSPATQSVMLALYARRGGTEIGRLFGALSVVQALRYDCLPCILCVTISDGLILPTSSQILGPAVYGLVYMKTVATYPRTIFWVSVATVTTSFILINFVRLPSEREYRQENMTDLEERDPLLPQTSHGQEDTLVDDRINSSRNANNSEHQPASYGSTTS